MDELIEYLLIFLLHFYIIFLFSISFYYFLLILIVTFRVLKKFLLTPY